MGGVLAFSAAKYLHRDIEPVRRLFRDIRVKRRKRKILVERYQPLRKMGLFDIRAPLDAEQYLWALPGFERIYLKEKRNGEVIKDEAPWLNKLYRQEGVTPENVPDFGLE